MPTFNNGESGASVREKINEAINNGGGDYQALLDFRIQAKALADGWINQ